MKEDFQGYSIKDFADHHARQKERALALLTAAHPTPWYVGGYGRNTDWASMTVRDPFSIDSSGGETWAQHRVKSDVTLFRMLGPGHVVVPPDLESDLVFQVGRASRPTSKVSFTMPSNEGVANFSVDPFGYLRLEWIDGDTFELEGMAYSLG